MRLDSIDARNRQQFTTLESIREQLTDEQVVEIVNRWMRQRSLQQKKVDQYKEWKKAQEGRA